MVKQKFEEITLTYRCNIFSAFSAAALERMRCGSGEGRRSDCNELKSQWRPSQSRKESTLNCLLMGRRCFIYTNEGRIRSR